MSPILSPTIQQLIVHMGIKIQDSSCCSSREECDTKNILRYGFTELRTDQIQYSSTF